MILTWATTVAQQMQVASSVTCRQRSWKYYFYKKKNFTFEEVFNKKNDKIYLNISKDKENVIPRVYRGQHPAAVKAFYIFTFVKKVFNWGKSVPAPGFRMREKQLSNSLFNGEHWLLQQDSTTAYKEKSSNDLKAKFLVLLLQMIGHWTTAFRQSWKIRPV